MEQWATLPLTPRSRVREPPRNPNWTLDNAKRSTTPTAMRVSRGGVEVTEERAQIEGTRTALTKFAVRNQRIVVDPFPNRNSHPRPVFERRNPIADDRGNAAAYHRRAVTPVQECGPSAAAIASRRVTYNPALQMYQTRDVAVTSAAERGLASQSSCFAVDRSISSSEWRSTALNVSDIAVPGGSRRRVSPTATRNSDVSDINFPQRTRNSPARDASRGCGALPRPAVTRPEWWGC